MLLLYFAWAFIVSSLMQSSFGFPPQSQQISLGPVAPENVPYPLQGLDADEDVRGVYDPGEDPFKQSSSLAGPDEYNNMGNDMDVSDTVLLKSLEDQIQQDQDIAAKSALLLKFLEDPSMQTLPVIYVENEEQAEMMEPLYQTSLEKRSRYYRRYPWKRQNSRHRTYEADTRYLCVPSREDVFKLLVGLHENRNGNHQKTVSFCNRKRPAKAIFTNIRFLG